MAHANTPALKTLFPEQSSSQQKWTCAQHFVLALSHGGQKLSKLVTLSQTRWGGFPSCWWKIRFQLVKFPGHGESLRITIWGPFLANDTSGKNNPGPKTQRVCPVCSFLERTHPINTPAPNRQRSILGQSRGAMAAPRDLLDSRANQRMQRGRGVVTSQLQLNVTKGGLSQIARHAQQILR